MAKISTWIAAKTILFFLKSGKTEALVLKLGRDMDKMIDQKFDGESEKIQQRLVEYFLIPLGRHLMKENPVGFKALLKGEIDES